ncbi:MAG: glycosyltransferase family 2 protein, partial [Deltaproteobacteria bacterium]
MNSLVVPIFKNETSIPKLVDVCDWLQSQLNETLEVVFVVDGSPDQSLKVLKALLPLVTFQYQVIELSKNFGSFSAIKKGLELAKGDFFAVMAADLQEPKELIVDFFKTLETQEYEVVLGKRDSRKDPFVSRITANSFWWLYRKLIQPEMPKGGVDIFGCNKTFRDHLIKLNESHSSLVGLIFWMGFRRKIISYSRQEREHGKSAWTFSKKFRYMLDNIFSFTDLPIQMLVLFGFTGVLTSLGLGALILISKLSGAIAVP